MITDTNIPNPEDFRFTEILDDTLPYQIVGYAEGVCPDATNPYGYIPPSGWKVSSCTWMPPGSHGVSVGKPTILVYCEPIKPYVEPLEIGELTSILYPDPSDHAVITGRAYSIPGLNGFYIEQDNYIRFSMYEKTLAQLGYLEGEQVVASVKLSPVYEDIIDVDQWGYVAQLIDIRRESEPEKLSEIPRDSQYIAGVDPVLIVAGVAVAAGAALVGGYILLHSRKR